MKPEVIPAILAQSKKEFFNKLEIASTLSKTVQIDIMDGLLVKNKTPRDLNNGRWFAEYLLNPREDVPSIELHLMVEDPWSIVREWHEYLEFKRAIWHVEVPIEHGELIEMVHEFNIEVGLAVSPSTPIKSVVPFISSKTKSNPEFVDEILVMGVKPGKSGQKLVPETLKKIRSLRQKFPKLNIGEDGGISLENTKTILRAGANRLNAAGAIFLAKDPKQAFQKLSKNNS
jgi:ribulose-phosphate 3-epimerase